MRLVIEIPDDDVAEFARLIAAHLAVLIQPPAQPPRSDRPDRAPGGPPTDGRTLLGWADRQGLRAAVLKLGRSRRYPSKVLTWTAEQVADVVHELTSKPPKGSQDWGGAAGLGKF